jgi:hypothetical protein
VYCEIVIVAEALGVLGSGVVVGSSAQTRLAAIGMAVVELVLRLFAQSPAMTMKVNCLLYDEAPPVGRQPVLLRSSDAIH